MRQKVELVKGGIQERLEEQLARLEGNGIGDGISGEIGGKSQKDNSAPRRNDEQAEHSQGDRPGIVERLSNLCG